MTASDPYLLDESQIAAPPIDWIDRLRHVGPGLILSASIVGSGELIATTTLGAKAGFATLWIILLSCTIKVAMQLEFGRYTIQSGETCMAALNHMPGKFGRAHWAIWLIMLLQPIKILQMGGILGGVAIVMQTWFPGVSITVWVWTWALLTSLLVSIRQYWFIERMCLGLLMAFTLLTLVSVGALQWTPYAIGWEQIASGLKGTLPPHAVVFIIGTFGLTGIGGDEILHYSYWLIEKGYAARTGPYKPGDPEWQARARGWIRTMHVDAMLSMVCYTIVTAAFYVLGAAVLHSRGDVPEGYQLIESLSRMYTESLGDWGKSIFLAGAFVVLFSSMFAALAAWVRMYADAFGKFGWIEWHNVDTRRRTLTVLTWVIPVCWAVAFLRLEQPVLMVILGGLATATITLIVAFAAVFFRYGRTLPELQPTKLFDVAFWISTLVIFVFGVYLVAKSTGLVD